MPVFSGRPIRNIRCASVFSELKNVTFQKDLGSYHEKTLRVQRLASWLLAESIKQSGREFVLASFTKRSAWQKPI